MHRVGMVMSMAISSGDLPSGPYRPKKTLEDAAQTTGNGQTHDGEPAAAEDDAAFLPRTTVQRVIGVVRRHRQFPNGAILGDEQGIAFDVLVVWLDVGNLSLGEMDGLYHGAGRLLGV